MAVRTFPIAGKTANPFVVVTFKYPAVDVKYEGEENMSRNPMLYKTLVVGVIVLFIIVGIQPAIANDIAIFDEKSKKYENNSKIKNFWDIIIFLLDLFEKIINKILETTISLISAIVFIILLLFLG